MSDKQNISEMDPKDLPNKRAFQDGFTREFMSSTEEVEAGYYLFESKTGGYTMWYPENANLDQYFCEKHGDYYEAIHFGESWEEENLGYFVRVTYDKGNLAKDPESGLHLLSAFLKYDGDYEQSESGNNLLYFATKEYITKGSKKSVNNILGLIKSKNSDQAVRFVYSISCLQGQECSYDLEALQE